MSPEKLVYMANQIAIFFAAQGEEAAPAAVAEHLHQFWDPRMRRAIVAFVAAGGEGLDPVAAKAVGLLAAEARPERATAV
ncbi:formate dehydrogenase [Kaistia algarum]|uniref:formate dehydrogenase subunit delta n=1 Tax=Kaistia algarum TaxID=2083279 RepID=UPI000CE8DA8B|nr:formate dehydrogenase subunit delta [Kaistia algarum]MCX5513065.1 formate dehydrogenase subunit delta [Kaistia algarum]PPE81457.1 formate dehydrogenase [Kaistia algarum]